MSLSSVVSMGYGPTPGATTSLVCLMGYGNGAAPPPIPPDPPAETPAYFGPALTAAQRRKWFSDREALRARAPVEIEPVADVATVIAKQAPKPEPKVFQKVFAKAPSPEAMAKVKARVAAQLKSDETLRAQEAKEMDEEEKEAMSLLAGMFIRID